ncbi:alpha trans-inducing transcription factor [Phycomyces blakesleeanus NRRL 1555(-)]|uniref:Mediator of RNA polymerase II transcription subunit 13 n=2 Tax=Phycomyces blakesleeanus TaxID=4837 RepID=A0A167NQ48_PHYB8|nr:alpha trans-inducing transcription factor [Phycomyces blakesleeanus NRRL 1555(-)]OAD76439.1 alpha trans-inducing transcription factor [Phycomyces blakesleeanus NRRL 1555(-)]|eukprot:XP_018294479.1 alpha trans-inducing transcription factor [Phycomyces blakesleeanus NRRL 1555(-)]
MLTDSSLTNILIVSGVSQIRYRVYGQHCKRSSLVDFIKCEPSESSTTGNIKPTYSGFHGDPLDPTENILIKTFKTLTQLGILCMWRMASENNECSSSPTQNPDQDIVPLELWVFWFDEKHTGKIDSNYELSILDELKVGSFTWENVSSKGVSPTASPLALHPRVGSSSLVAVSEEYKLFMKSIQSVIQWSIQQKGAIPLGDFLLFPLNIPDNNDTEMEMKLSPEESTDEMVDSVLSCTYNVYLASTNLIIQPSPRRMRIRPLHISDLKNENLKVRIGPSGEYAKIAPQQDISQQLETNVLLQWSLLFSIPVRYISRPIRKNNSQVIPQLTTILTLRNELVLYPTALIFVPVSAQQHSTPAAGMNSTLRYNQGYTEDLGEKWSRQTWNENIINTTKLHNQNMSMVSDEYGQRIDGLRRHINYWSYMGPKEIVMSNIFEVLSTSDGCSSQELLKKALAEPVLSSPLMVAKSLATPTSLGPKAESVSNDMAEDMEDTDSRISESFENYTGISLKEFATTFFLENANQMLAPNLLISADHKSTTPNSEDNTRGEYIQGLEISQNIDINGFNISESAGRNMPTQPLLQTNEIIASNEAGVLQNLLSGPIQNEMISSNSDYLAPEMTGSNGDIDSGFDIGGMAGMAGIDSMDTMMYGMPDRWGGDDNLDDYDNFDFSVTEEDFKFFESGPNNRHDEYISTAHGGLTTGIQEAQSLDVTDPTLLLIDTFTEKGLGENEMKEKELDFSELFAASRSMMEDTMMIDQSTRIFDESKPIIDSSILMENTAGGHLALDSEDTLMTDVDTMDNHHSSFSNHQFSSTITPKTGQHGLDVVSNQYFVQSELSPVIFSERVNDAKYYNGGKFMYVPPSEKNKTANRKTKQDIYRPDYIPVIKKRVQKWLDDRHPKHQHKAYDNSVKTVSSPIKKPKTEFEDVISSSSSSCYTSSSSSYESESESDSETEVKPIEKSGTKDIIATPKANNAITVQKHMGLLKCEQDIFVSRILIKPGETQKYPLFEKDLGSEYTHPFAEAVVPGPVNSVHLPNEALCEEDYRALDSLFQQVVMGGYPFSGSLAAVSANAGEISEGESATMIVARRRDLIQSLHGDISHIPSLASDYTRITQSFKIILTDIFDQRKFNQTSLYPSGMDHPALPSFVSVKGPLNVQQYYDLSETNQAHSKYGKYQIKKRRPAEPNLDTLIPPNIVVSRQENLLEGSPKLLTFWEKLRLAPYSPPKNINYFVVFPKNEDLESNVSHFFRGLSTVYDTCLLGSHYPAKIGNYRRGLVPVPILPRLQEETWDDQQLRSYTAECRNLGAALRTANAENMHIVIYIVNPSSHLSANLELSRCFRKLVVEYQKTFQDSLSKPTDKNRARLVMQLIPIEHILRSTSFGGYLKFGFKEVAFSVYTKCHTVVGRNHGQVGNNEIQSATELYTPPFVLAKPIPETINFSVKEGPHSFPIILEDNASLHLGYCFSIDHRWMILVWTDHRGELIEFSVLDCIKNSNGSLSAVFEEAWWRTKEISRRTGFPWTYVIAKIGLMFEDELKAWMDIIPNDEKAVIVCVDMESTLYLHLTADATSIPYEQSHTPNSGGVLSSDILNNSPSMNANATHSTRPTDSTDGEVEDTHALLLNHRVAYSRKREKISEGILCMDPNSEVEDWMLPLASGYMVHKAPENDSPCKEQFNHRPLVVEVHLVYNQTAYSAYSTLRDIIKRYHALSFVNSMPSSVNRLPIHLVLVERLCRILLVVDPSF